MDADSSPGSAQLDLALVRGVLAGDAGSIEDFVRHLARVPAMLRGRNQRLGNPLDAHELADVAQETFSAVWRKLSEFRGEARLDTWIHRFGWNELMKAIERKWRRERPMDPHLESSVEARSAGSEAAIDPALVHASLQQLAPDEQAVLHAVHFEHASFAEVARARGEPLGTVKTRYYRGIERLRVALSGHWRRAFR